MEIHLKINKIKYFKKFLEDNDSCSNIMNSDFTYWVWLVVKKT